MDDNQLASFAENELRQCQDVINSVVGNALICSALVRWGRKLASSLESGGTLFFAGNGGSFADAVHFAAEFTGKMGRRRPPLSAYALGSNGASVTAIGNDYGFDDVFSRELRGLYTPHCALVVFTTSGSSPNILNLVEAAVDLGVPAFALTGGGGGAIIERCEAVVVPSTRTERIQEVHTLLGHILCSLVEQQLAETFFKWE